MRALGNAPLQFVFDALGAQAHELDVFAIALGAALRDALGIVAIVAQHAAVAAVIGEGDGAVGALDALAAGAAGDEAREAAAVEQQHGLFAVGEARGHGVDQRAREGGVFAGFEELLAHVDQFDLRHGAALDALRQFEQRVLSGLGVVAGFQTGRGGAQHYYGARMVRAHDRHVAAVIARRFLLLIALVVLFVDDDQSEIADRREDAGAGRDDHCGFAGADAAPFLGAFGVVERGVQNRDAFAEALIELACYGGGEADFGDQHQRAAA